MRYLNLLLVLLLFSCTSNKNTADIDQTVRIWEIQSYIQDDIEFMNTEFEEAYLTYNLKTDKLYITYSLSQEALLNLQNVWVKREKGLELTGLDILQDIKVITRRDKKEIYQIEMKKVDTDYILHGIKTEKLADEIYEITNTERIGESSGVFGLLYNILEPTSTDLIPLPELKEDDIFKFSIVEKNIHLSNQKTVIVFESKGSHRWLGF